MEMWCQMSGNGALQWLGDLIAHSGLEPSVLRPGETDFLLNDDETYSGLGPSQDTDMTAPSLTRVFL